MPRQRGQKQNFTFNKGWNTEASPLTFPENTAKDLDNVVLDIDGSIRRRMGIACAGPDTTRYLPEIATNYTTKAIAFYKWENVAGSGNLSFLVSQVGTKLQFNFEDGSNVGTIDFSDLIISGRTTDAPKATVEVASGLGYLFVTGPFTEPFYVSYSGGSLSKTSFNIEIRDFEGVDDGLAVDERPATLTNLHEYNLKNQGWPASYPCDSGSDPIARTFAVLGGYPSNADVLYFGKTSTGTTEADIGVFNPTTMSKNLFGTTPAANGHFILDAFNQDRATAAGVSGTIITTINNRPRATAFHNGRAFFAGVNAEGYTGKVYYSQQLDDISKVGHCYQLNDPTAEEFNELLATDGGVITIPGCGNILRIQEGSQGIVVFASNGMWEITGENGKFSADNFFVRKVTDIGCISGDSVVNADGTFYYFSDAGIVGTQSDQVTGNVSAGVITTTNIQLGYLLFGGPQRRGARGVWIRGEKKVVWLYSTKAEYNGVDDRFKYNGVLILDVNLGAFYKYSISDFNVDGAPYISGIVESSNAIEAGIESEFLVDTITSTWKMQVVRPTVTGTSSAVGIDFATFSARTFTDWYWEDEAGANYTSYLEAGYDYGGQAMFDKKPTYVYTYMSRVSKSNQTGGFYNIPDPTDTVIVVPDACNVVATWGINPVERLNTGVIVYAPTFNADKTKLYINNAEYELSTAGDVSTGVANGVTVTVTPTGSIKSTQFTNNGTKFFVCTDYGFEVFNVPVPYDLSSAVSIDAATAYIGGGSNLDGAWIDSTGANAWLLVQNLGGSNTLRYVNFEDGAYNFTTVTTTSSANVSAGVGDLNVGPRGGHVTDDFTTIWLMTKDGRAVPFLLETSFSSVTAHPDKTFFEATDYGVTSSTDIWGLWVDNDTTEALIGQQTNNYVTHLIGDCALCGTLGVLSTPATATFSSAINSPNNITFDPTGTKMYGGNYGGSLYQYSLSTAWDITTATLDGTYNPGISRSYTITWYASGSKFAVAELGGSPRNNKVFSVGTPYDITSTVTFLSQKSAAYAQMCFLSDTTFMDANGLSYTFDGSDLTTVSASTDYSSIVGVASSYAGFQISSDGLSLYRYTGLGAGNTVTEFALSAAFDPSSAVATGVTFTGYGVASERGGYFENGVGYFIGDHNVGLIRFFAAQC